MQKVYKVASENFFKTGGHASLKTKVANSQFTMSIHQLRQRHCTMNITTEDITCQVCRKCFSERSVFNKHFRQYHKKNESDCLVCGKNFYTEFMLKNHIARSHTDVKCDICDKTVTKRGLSKHIQTHQDIKFECEMCDNVYNRRDKLEKHKTTCGANMVRVRKAPTEAYKCDACEKIFTQKRYLSQHKRTHAVRMTLREYDCKFCEKIYTSNQSLGKHIQKNHPNPRRVENANVGVFVLDSSTPPPKVRQKNKKIFNCKQCNYESGRSDNLKRHLETHSTNRVKTGRPKKPPGELSSVTKRIYAKRSYNEFMEEMRKNNLEEEIMKLMEKDAP